MKKSFRKILAFLLVFTILGAIMLTTGCEKKHKKYSDDDDLHLGEDAFVGKDGSVGRVDFIDTLGGVSETYEGSVSLESYSSADEAAEAFVAEEIAGESKIEVLNTTSHGELSGSEIKDLRIPDEFQEGMTGVEKMEIEYSIEEEGIVSTADTLNKSKKVTVYVIKYTNNWKYYSPAPITGDTITKSYYDSVFNYEKYKNCTLETTTSISIKASGSDSGELMSMSSKVTMYQKIMHADNKVYLEQTISATYDGESYEESIYAYMEEIDGEVVCYVKTDVNSSDWYETHLSTIGFNNLDELTPFYDSYLDYTYFTKTDYGFELNNANADQYVRETLAGEGLGDMFGAGGLDIDMFAEYYVSQGVLSGMRMDAEIKINVAQDGVIVDAVESVTGTTKVTNYGTTVVEKPFTE